VLIYSTDARQVSNLTAAIILWFVVAYTSSLSDDNVYKTRAKEQRSITGKVEALDYVSANYSLLSSKLTRFANSVIEFRSYIRHHIVF
jgi:hypothetical protein